MVSDMLYKSATQGTMTGDTEAGKLKLNHRDRETQRYTEKTPCFSVPLCLRGSKKAT
jgi:hypothetical protein